MTRRHWLWALLAAVLVVEAVLLWVVGLRANRLTDSLPHKMYAVLYWDRVPQRGGFYMFECPDAWPHAVRAPFVKQVLGVPGDRVEVRGREVFVNGVAAGMAKERSKYGMPLGVSAEGHIPPGFYYVYAPHPDSFDSRYSQVGLVHERHILGRAVPLW